MNPLFTIILTTYNRRQFLARAINSVLQQKFTQFELIIVDDYTTDETQSLVDSYKDSRITYIRQSHHQGVSAARNTGILLAKSEYICFLDDDDEYLPLFLQEVNSFLKRKKKNYTGFIWFGVMNVYKLSNKKIKTTFLKPQFHNEKNLSFLRNITYSAVVFHYTCFKRAGMFNTALYYREDTDLIFRLLTANIPYTSIPNVLKKIHIHDQPSLSRTIQLTDRIYNLEKFLFLQDYFLDKHLSLWLYFYSCLVGDYYRLEKRTLARRLARSILKKCWYYPRIWDLFWRFEFKALISRLLK